MHIQYLYLTKAVNSFSGDTYQNIKKAFFNGKRITPGQKKAPAKASSFNRKNVLTGENTWQYRLKPELNTPHSLHNVNDFQREVLNIAAMVLEKSDPALKVLNNQMELAKTQVDRPATKQELATAKAFKNNIIDLIAKRHQQQKNLPAKEAYAAAVNTYRQARVNYINNQPWQAIQNNITYKQHTYISTQLPAAEMKNGKQDIFVKSYDGKGVCSWDTSNTTHSTNLWLSRLDINENGQAKTLFSGLRHGALSPYHVENLEQRQAGAENRAKEVLSAALYSKPELLAKALNGETVNLKLVSTGLLTATKVSKEATMVDDQMRAWQTLTQPCQILQMEIKNKQGKLQTVKIKPDVAAFNFGVNELALKLGLGHRASDNYNVLALQQLFGCNLSPEARPGGWVGEYLDKSPGNYKIVNTLSKQVKEIWQNKLHHKDGGEPYKAAQRIVMLAHEINAVACWNCKSGKDRTGMLDAEIKREAISLHQGKVPSSPGSNLDHDGQNIFQKVLLNSGNLEIQAQNTSAAGSKVMKKIWPNALSLSYQKRIGNPGIWQSVKGLSSLVVY